MITTLSDFLSESGIIQMGGSTRSVTLDEQEALDFIESDAKTFASGGMVLYRGAATSTDPYLWLDPSVSRRRAMGDMPNHYNLIMSNLPSWSDMPPRDSSVIMTDTMALAKTYGEVYTCIPMDGADMGVLWQGDIWTSFGRHSTNNKEELAYPHVLAKYLKDRGVNSTDWNLFSSDMDKFVSEMLKGEEGEMLSRGVTHTTIGIYNIFRACVEGDSTWLQCLENYFDIDDKTHVDLVKYGKAKDINSLRPDKFSVHGAEYWTDYPCLLVHITKWPKLQSRFNVKMYT